MNAEIVKVARKAAAHYKNSDGYAQASEIITMLCDELEKTQQPVAERRTVASVLLERWAKDTEAMASRMIGYDESESKFFTTNIDGEITNRYEHVRLALEAQIAYLNSAAEVGK